MAYDEKYLEDYSTFIALMGRLKVRKTIINMN